MEANATGARGVKTRKAIDMMRKSSTAYRCRSQARDGDRSRKRLWAIVDKVLELGDGDVAVGVVRGFEAGTIDISLGLPISTLMELLFRCATQRARYAIFEPEIYLSTKKFWSTTDSKTEEREESNRAPKWIMKWRALNIQEIC